MINGKLMEQVQYAQLLGVTVDNLPSYVGEAHWWDNIIIIYVKLL